VGFLGQSLGNYRSGFRLASDDEQHPSSGELGRVELLFDVTGFHVYSARLYGIQGRAGLLEPLLHMLGVVREFCDDTEPAKPGALCGLGGLKNVACLPEPGGSDGLG